MPSDLPCCETLFIPFRKRSFAIICKVSRGGTRPKQIRVQTFAAMLLGGLSAKARATCQRAPRFCRHRQLEGDIPLCRCGGPRVFECQAPYGDCGSLLAVFSDTTEALSWAAKGGCCSERAADATSVQRVIITWEMVMTPCVGLHVCITRTSVQCVYDTED